MKKAIYAIILCLALASCGAKQAAAGVPNSIGAFVEAFNLGADGTACALGEAADAEDGTKTIATKNKDSSVFCTEDDGVLKKIEIEGSGIFQPGLGSFDYMVYAVIACDPSFDYKGAGDMIASMYYEAYTGGDAVEGTYNGVKYSFHKDAYYCMLTIEPAAEQTG